MVTVWIGRSTITTMDSPPVRGGTTFSVSNRSLAPFAWMVCGCFLFARMGQFAHALGATCDWRIVALSRSFLAFSLALVLARLTGARLVLLRPRILWLRSIVGSMSLLCTFFAL